MHVFESELAIDEVLYHQEQIVEVSMLSVSMPVMKSSKWDMKKERLFLMYIVTCIIKNFSENRNSNF